jgi:hypothetical protein
MRRLRLFFIGCGGGSKILIFLPLSSAARRLYLFPIDGAAAVFILSAAQWLYLFPIGGSAAVFISYRRRGGSKVYG